MSVCWLLVLEGTQMKRSLVLRVCPFIYALFLAQFRPVSYTMLPFSRFLLHSFFFSVFQTLLYFEQDVFFLQLGRG